ncbi:hypothetical protein GOBAR_DD13898 [Gossypium barbadense]|nr:hypothetical protein GOBAR_DD13898 [Gossypium barbadense]
MARKAKQDDNGNYQCSDCNKLFSSFDEMRLISSVAARPSVYPSRSSPSASVPVISTIAFSASSDLLCRLLRSNLLKGLVPT